MKKYLIIIMIVIATGLFALKNWKVYTNTTHIFDIIETGNELHIATWGGLLNYDLNNNLFGETLTTINGLGSNDIRALDYLEGMDQILVGTAGNGINRIDESGFLIPLTETLGLQSDIINKIAHNDSLIFVATRFGVSCFKDDPDFPFPLLLNNYNMENGISANDITSMQLTPEGNIFFGSIAGFDYVHIDSLDVITSWHHLNTDNSLLPSNNVTSISISGEKIAIGTDNGVFLTEKIFDPTQISIIDEGHAIYPVFVDDQLNLWYSYGIWDLEILILTDTMDIAITRISVDNEVETWNKNENGLTTSKIKGFKEINGYVSIFTWGEGIFLFDGTIWENAKTNSICANVVTDIEIDQNSKVWVCNGHFGDGMINKGTRGVSGFDGSHWTNYDYLNSELKSDNIMSIGVDALNRKWFGAWATDSSVTGWASGISVLDDSELPVWSWITAYSSNIYTNTISHIAKDSENRMWVCSYDGGVSVLDEDANMISRFTIPDDEQQKIIISHYSGNRTCLGSFFNGLRIWENFSIPDSLHNYWTVPPFSDLSSSCMVFGINAKNINGIEETWIASSAGLFMYNGEYWYKYGTNIKKKVWDGNDWFWNEGNPDPEYWYYEGQERLYGSISTYPTALFIDPFGMIWIGTQDAGITIFDTSRDKFINLTTDNTPLISNTITDFAYEPITGTLYIGTNSGMNSVEIGISAEMNEETELFETIVFPNPFYPEKDDIIRIENKGSITMPKGDTYCRIFDLNGDLVMEIEKDIYEQFSWDGLNKTGKKCGSGIYFYVISASEGQISKGKIVLVR
ncbi:MAG: T9SS type A sorting domain-containing protein [Candidatus Tenebribacter burtonii]|nr:T9SS type A sorting domain-containing protein [Candidatus Tenebribacter burtonii]